jgi:hypothetical protein
MGLGAYCHPAREVDADRLLEQFRDLEKHAADVRRTLTEKNRVAAQQLAQQFTALTKTLFPAKTHAHALRKAP